MNVSSILFKIVGVPSHPSLVLSPKYVNSHVPVIHYCPRSGMDVSFSTVNSVVYPTVKGG